MPKIGQTNPIKNPSLNGIPEEKTLNDVLRQEKVEIKSARYVDDPKHETSTWADMEKIISGVKWLIPGWVPQSMLTGLVAEPKMGKSGFALWGLIRPIVTGCNFFTGHPCSDPGYVLYCDTERSAAINIERMRKWGILTDRILMPFKDPNKIIDINEQETIDRIHNVVCRKNVKHIVVDSYRGSHKRDENKSCTYSGLQNLGGICEETRVGCSLIHHAGKLIVGEDLTLNCGRGSNAFLAAVRCQIAIDRPDLKSDWKRLQVLGENLGTCPTPVGFRFRDWGLEFGLAPQRHQQDERTTRKGDAKQWLLDNMEPNVWMDAGPLIEEAAEAGYPYSGSLSRARNSLGIKTEKFGKISKWMLVQEIKEEIKGDALDR